jgi:hypothetical protein
LAKDRLRALSLLWQAGEERRGEGETDAGERERERERGAESLSGKTMLQANWTGGMTACHCCCACCNVFYVWWQCGREQWNEDEKLQPVVC